MKTLIALLVLGACIQPAPLCAQTKVMEAEIYYISRGAQKDQEMEDLAYRLLVGAEIKINASILQ